MDAICQRILVLLLALTLQSCSDSTGHPTPVSPNPVEDHYACAPFSQLGVGDVARWDVLSQKRGNYVVELQQMSADVLKLTKTGAVQTENLLMLNKDNECPHYVSEAPLDEIDAYLVYGTSPVRFLAEERVGLSNSPDPLAPPLVDPDPNELAECYVVPATSPHHEGQVQVCSDEFVLLEQNHFHWRSEVAAGSLISGSGVVSLLLEHNSTLILQITLTGMTHLDETPP